MSDQDRPDTQVIVDTAIESVRPEALSIDTLYGQVLPAGAEHRVIDLEPFRPSPNRPRGVVKAQTVDAFTRYVARHDEPETTTLWVDAESYWLIALLNDHAGVGDVDQAGWGDHRATLKLKTTPEWDHWLSRDGQLLAQEDFAEHIEDGLAELVTPDGATMLEVAQSIQGTTTAEFKAASRLSNGAIGLQWVEEQTAKAGSRGELEIPERFELAIAPFVGEEAYKVSARLRYRIRGGNALLGYRLDRPEAVIRDAIELIAIRLEDQFKDRVFVGVPRGS